MEVFHRIFHMLDTNENVPTAVLAIGTKNTYLYNKSVMVLEGISSLENANIFLVINLIYFAIRCSVGKFCPN